MKKRIFTKTAGVLSAALLAGLATGTDAQASGMRAISDVIDISKIQIYIILPDGSLQITFTNGDVLIVAAGRFEIIDCEVFLTVEEADRLVAVMPVAGEGFGAAALIGAAAIAGGAALVVGVGGGGGTVTATSDTAPVFSSGATASVAENQTSAYTAVASDADGDTLSYSLSGTDAALFEINTATGVVTFIAAPDFEVPGDAGGNNVYDIIVTASDGINTSDQSVAITVTDINDVAPVFSSGATASVAENQTSAYTAVASDAEGDNLSYSLSGTDAALFTIDTATGVVTFVAAPDFEAPTDAGGNNVYDIIVSASDGTNTTDQSVAITVTNDMSDDPAPVVDLTSLTAGEGFIIQGDVAGDYAGFSVSSAGDINGDGFDDLIVGARYGDDGGASAGEAYVIFGSASGFGSPVGTRQVLDLTNLTAGEGFIIQGDAGWDTAGTSVSSAGDINGDGFDDLMVGAPQADDGGSRAGETYVIFGSASGFGSDVGGRQVINLTTLTASQGFIIQGDVVSDRSGRSVSSAGDINGDGFDDMIVGAYNGGNGGSKAGEAYVIYGSASGFGSLVGARQVLDLTNLTDSQGFIIQGDAGGDYAASSVSSAGDINGDGFDDLIVGARYGDDGGSLAGEAYVIYGRATGPVVDQIITGTAGAENLVGGAGDDIITGNGGADVFRGGAGDDRIITSTFADIDGGRGTDILALTDTNQTLDLTVLNPAEIQSIERIQITDDSATGNTLVLDRLAVFDITEQRSNGTVTLIVDGTNTGTVDFSDTGWAANGTIVIDSNTYDIYENGNAIVQVQQGIAVTIAISSSSPPDDKAQLGSDFSADSPNNFDNNDIVSRYLVEPDKRAVSEDYLDSNGFEENNVDDDFETPEFTHIITDESFSVTESLDLNLGRNAQPEISTKFLAEFRANYEYDGFVDSPNDFDGNGLVSTDLVELENRVVTRSGENSGEIQTIRLVPEVLPPVIAEDLTDILPMNLEPTWDDIEFLSDRQVMLGALPIGDDLA